MMLNPESLEAMMWQGDDLEMAGRLYLLPIDTPSFARRKGERLFPSSTLEWKRHWKREGLALASLKDIYATVKEAYVSRDEKTLERIHTWLRRAWIVTNTALFADKDDPNQLNIRHSEGPGSSVTTIYSTENLFKDTDNYEFDELMNNSTGRSYVQSILGTSDHSDEIRRNLESVMNPISRHIALWSKKDYWSMKAPTHLCINNLNQRSLEISATIVSKGFSFGVRR